MSKDSTKDKEGKIIHINEEQIKDHLGEMVRGTVEETLNEMLEQEAEQLVGASPLRIDVNQMERQRLLR